ncbi:MAG: RNA methyltransferase [Lachnospiraceae bacterium]|nr:RNA methyltransferase [Lachnospiraceae bacterium]
MRLEEIKIDSPDAKELEIYASVSEPQLRHYYEPEPGIFIAESLKIIPRALRAGYEPLSFFADEKKVPGLLSVLEDFEAEAAAAGSRRAAGADEIDSRIEERDPEAHGTDLGDEAPAIPCYTAQAAVLDKAVGYHLTGGALCAMRRRVLPSVEDVLAAAGWPRRITVLEGVTNPTNVGAIFRSAAALGAGAILLTGGCGDPLQRRAVRVGMGTVFQIPWTYLPNTSYIKKEIDEGVLGVVPTHEKAEYIEYLRRLGYKTAAMALTDRSVSVSDPGPASEDKLAIVLGNEGEGLLQSTIDACDYTVKIPMAAGVDSLNVAAASAVAFWALCNQ